MLRRPSSLVLAAIMAAMVVLWFELPVNAQTAAPTTANLWVGASGSCTRSATPNGYNSSTSCSSFQSALTAAQGGDTVLILNGTYGSQNLASNGKTSTVSFYAQTPKQVLVSGLSVGVDHVHVTGVIMTGSGNSRGRLSVGLNGVAGSAWTDVVIDGMAARGVTIWESGVTIQNSEFGNANSCPLFSSGGEEDAVRFWGWGSGNTNAPSNITFKNNTVHDWTAAPDGVCGGTVGDIHPDNIQIYMIGGTADNIVITGNKFWNGPSSNIQAGGASISNWTIENNYFGGTECCNNIVVGQATCSGYVRIRNNVFNFSSGYVDNNAGTPNCSVTPDISSNIFLNSLVACTASAGATGGFNVYAGSGGATCGSNAKHCTPAWLNGTPSASNNYDIRLAASDTCAKDAGNSASFAPTDMFGTLRTPPIDAGAFALSSGVASIAPPSGLTLSVQ